MKLILIPLIIIGAYLGSNIAVMVGMATFGGKVIEQAYIVPPGTSAIDQPSGRQTKINPDFQLQRASSVQGTVGIE